MKNLYKTRMEKRLSQKQLAELVNVSQQVISDYEHGKTTPKMEILTKLAQVLNVSIDELVKDPNEYNPYQDLDLPCSLVLEGIEELSESQKILLNNALQKYYSNYLTGR